MVFNINIIDLYEFFFDESFVFSSKQIERLKSLVYLLQKNCIIHTSYNFKFLKGKISSVSLVGDILAMKKRPAKNKLDNKTLATLVPFLSKCKRIMCLEKMAEFLSIKDQTFENFVLFDYVSDNVLSTKSTFQKVSDFLKFDDSFVKFAQYCYLVLDEKDIKDTIMLNTLDRIYIEFSPKKLNDMFVNYMKYNDIKKASKKNKNNVYISDGSSYSWNKVECCYYKEEPSFGSQDLGIYLRKESGRYLIVDHKNERFFEKSYDDIICYNQKKLFSLFYQYVDFFYYCFI